HPSTRLTMLASNFSDPTQRKDDAPSTMICATPPLPHTSPVPNPLTRYPPPATTHLASPDAHTQPHDPHPTSQLPPSNRPTPHMQNAAQWAALFAEHQAKASASIYCLPAGFVAGRTSQSRLRHTPSLLSDPALPDHA